MALDTEIMQDLVLERLRETCSGLGPSKVALDTDTPVSSVSAYLNGKRSPKVDFLRKVATKYGVSIEWLLGFPDAPKYPGFEERNPDEDIVILSRAAKKMTPENRKKLLEMARVMFNDAFDD